MLIIIFTIDLKNNHMKNTRYTLIIIFGLLIQGCAINQKSMIGQKQLKIENQKVTKPYVNYVYAYEKNGELLIRGTVRLKNKVRYRDPHVDLSIYSSSGNLIDSICTNYYPRHTYRKGYIKGRFHAVFNDVPPKGSVLKVSHHKTRVGNSHHQVNSTLTER